jgi:hypothetical protein
LGKGWSRRTIPLLGTGHDLNFKQNVGPDGKAFVAWALAGLAPSSSTLAACDDAVRLLSARKIGTR